MEEQDWANLSHYKEENLKLKSSSLNEQRILFYGDSITEQWAEIVPEYFSENLYINRGIGGQTTPQMLIRFRQDVIKLKPAVVIILAGTNDIAGNTGPSTLEMILDNIISMVEMALANNIKVILASVLPVYEYPWAPGLEPADKIVELNNMIKNYADKSGITYLDYYSALVDERKGMREEYTTDGVHLNVKGYNKLIPLAEEAIAKVLK